MLRRRLTLEPCLPRPAKEPPAGPGWIHEIKHDGFRILARRDAECVRLFTRHGTDFTARYPKSRRGREGCRCGQGTCLLMCCSCSACNHKLGERTENRSRERVLKKSVDLSLPKNIIVAGVAKNPDIAFAASDLFGLRHRHLTSN